MLDQLFVMAGARVLHSSDDRSRNFPSSLRRAKTIFEMPEEIDFHLRLVLDNSWYFNLVYHSSPVLYV